MPRLAVAGDEVVLGREETDVALDERQGAGGIVEHSGLGADVALRAFVDRPRFGLWLTAPPALHDARVARSRHAARTEVGSEQHRVLVEIGDRGFRLRELEAVLGEGPRGEVELTHHDRIATAP